MSYRSSTFEAASSDSVLFKPKRDFPANAVYLRKVDFSEIELLLSNHPQRDLIRQSEEIYAAFNEHRSIVCLYDDYDHAVKGCVEAGFRVPYLLQ